MKLIGWVILDEPLYPQIILALMKPASIVTIWDISTSIASSTPVQLAFTMPLIMSRIVAHSTVIIIQLAPYLPHLRHPTVLPLLPDRSVQYSLHLRIDSLLPPLGKPSMVLIALILPLRISSPRPSDVTMLVLPPRVQTMTMSMTLMLGVTSMENRIFQRCLNATLGVMLQLPVLFFLSLVFPMLPFRISTSRVFDPYQPHFFLFWFFPTSSELTALFPKNVLLRTFSCIT